MKKTLIAVMFASLSFGALAQSYNEVRAAGNLEGGINYVGVRRSYEVVGSLENLALSAGMEVGSILNKANLGPSVGIRLAPTSPLNFYAGVQRNLLLGENNYEYGAELKISNSARVSLGKIENERGSTTYVGVRVPTRKSASKM